MLGDVKSLNETVVDITVFWAALLYTVPSSARTSAPFDEPANVNANVNVVSSVVETVKLLSVAAPEAIVGINSVAVNRVDPSDL